MAGEGEAANSGLSASSSAGNPSSVEATNGGVSGGISCNKESRNDVPESCLVTSDPEELKSLIYADELMKDGARAAEDRDYAEAADCYSRALEIRVAHFGELSPECVSAYYKYGCALLYKAQDEADPLVAMPKKDEDSENDSSVKAVVAGESSAASVEEPGSAHPSGETRTAEGNGKEGDDSDDEELADGEEDESDLDLAWKMLDVARAIVEKHPDDTIEKVDILSALAEVALEREDVETSLSDYTKALSILTRLVEPDSRHIAELNFRICLCLEIGSKPEEAIPFCERAISVCKSRVQRLMNQVDNSSGLSEASTEKVSEEKERPPEVFSSSSLLDHLPDDRKAEIQTLDGLCGELEKKLEDLQQLVSNPKSILSDILGIMSAKARGAENNAAPVEATSATGSCSSTNCPQTNGASGVTHLGVVGRGVKRAVVSAIAESSTAKRSSLEPFSKQGDDGSNPFESV